MAAIWWYEVTSAKKRLMLRLILGVVILGIGLTIFYLRQNRSRQITFEACEKAGGTAWSVDPFHSDICPACADYQACAREYNDYRDVCPECYGPCQACQEKYSLYESCPECYGPCQSCQNEYRNEFESESERYELCPVCKTCDQCREEIASQQANCPPCLSCEACKEENKRYTDIRDV